MVKNAYRRPITLTKITHSKNTLPLDGEIALGEDDSVISSGIVLTDPAVCSAILCNYSRLKQDSWGSYETDTWYLIYDFERICDVALKDYPLYMRLVECKIDGLQNSEI